MATVNTETVRCKIVDTAVGPVEVTIVGEKKKSHWIKRVVLGTLKFAWRACKFAWRAAPYLVCIYLLVVVADLEYRLESARDNMWTAASNSNEHSEAIAKLQTSLDDLKKDVGNDPVKISELQRQVEGVGAATTKDLGTLHDRVERLEGSSTELKKLDAKMKRLAEALKD